MGAIPYVEKRQAVTSHATARIDLSARIIAAARRLLDGSSERLCDGAISRIVRVDVVGIEEGSPSVVEGGKHVDGYGVLFERDAVDEIVQAECAAGSRAVDPEVVPEQTDSPSTLSSRGNEGCEEETWHKGRVCRARANTRSVRCQCPLPMVRGDARD